MNTVLLGVLLVVLPCCIHACSPVIGATTPRPHTIEETLYDTNIVVHVVAGAKLEDTAYSPAATLTIKCVFKDRLNELPVGNQIALDTDDFTSCSGPWPMTEGEEYIMALRVARDGKFVPDEAEGNALERATFPASEENINTVLSLCGLRNPAGTQCPTVPNDDCEHAPYNKATTASTTPKVTTPEGTGMEATTTDDGVSVAAITKGHTFITLITLLLLLVIQ